MFRTDFPGYQMEDLSFDIEILKDRGYLAPPMLRLPHTPKWGLTLGEYHVRFFFSYGENSAK